MYYIYMLRCRDGSFYTGIAADIEKRLRQHASGGAACAKYTRAHPPEALAALWQAEDHAAAARLEALIKQLPRERSWRSSAGKRTRSPSSLPACREIITPASPQSLFRVPLCKGSPPRGRFPLSGGKCPEGTKGVGMLARSA
ncbi:MAG: GIY-YIG nuclease family protein [Oscillospiraceae bacterium]